MITLEQAKRAICDLKPDQIPAFVVDSLAGKKLPSLDIRWSDTAAEDIFIQLLKDQDLSTEYRKAILDGCRELFVQLDQYLDQANPPREDAVGDAFERLCRLINIAKPPELRARAKSLFHLASETPGADVRLLSSLVWAFKAYSQSEDDVPVWETLIKKHQEVAGHAFRALLQIDPMHPRVESHLEFLWMQMLVNNWEINVAFLTRAAVQARSSDGVARTVFATLQDADSEIVRKAKIELSKHSWARPLFRLFEDLERHHVSSEINRLQKTPFSNKKAWDLPQEFEGRFPTACFLPHPANFNFDLAFRLRSIRYTSDYGHRGKTIQAVVFVHDINIKRDVDESIHSMIAQVMKKYQSQDLVLNQRPQTLSSYAK